MSEDVPKPVTWYTGMIPAAPGWRAILSDGRRTYVVPIVGWAWQRDSWAEVADGYPAAPTGDAAITVEAGHIATLGDWLEDEDAGKGFYRAGLLAPGKQFGEKHADGWEVPGTEALFNDIAASVGCDAATVASHFAGERVPKLRERLNEEFAARGLTVREKWRIKGASAAEVLSEGPPRETGTR